MSKLRTSLGKLIDEVGKLSGCHRIPERSFFFRGHQFPVCARCTGVCIGQILSIFTNMRYRIPVQLSMGFLAIMGMDWGIQEYVGIESNNMRRLITGIAGGFGLISIYASIYRSIKSLFIID